MSENFLQLVKLAEKKKEDRSIDDKLSDAGMALTAQGVGLTGGMLANNVGAAPLLGDMVKDMRSPRRLITKSEYAELASAAKAMGYQERGLNSFYHPKAKRSLWFSHSPYSNGKYASPHFMPHAGERLSPKAGITDQLAAAFAKPTGGHIAVGNTKAFRSRGIVAHELGHSLQGRVALGSNILGKYGLIGGAAGVAASGVLRPFVSEETADNIGKGSAILGTMGGLATTLSEAHASYLGSKIMKGGLSQKLKPFKGVGSYLGMATIPAAMYAADSWLRGQSRPSNKNNNNNKEKK